MRGRGRITPIALLQVDLLLNSQASVQRRTGLSYPKRAERELGGTFQVHSDGACGAPAFDAQLIT